MLLSPVGHNTNVSWCSNIPSPCFIVSFTTRPSLVVFQYSVPECSQYFSTSVNYSYTRALRYCRNDCVAFTQVFFCEWVVLWVPGAVQWAAGAVRTVWLSSGAVGMWHRNLRFFVYHILSCSFGWFHFLVTVYMVVCFVCFCLIL